MKFSWNRWLVIAGVVTAGCFGIAAVQADGPASAPSTQPDPATTIATINGEPIPRDKFDSALMQIYGMKLFDEVLQLTVVQQACAKQHILIDEDKVNAERQMILNNLQAQNVPAGDRENVLAQMLQRQGVSQMEFRMTLTKNAGLRALAKGQVTVTDEELQKGFKFQYGEKVQVRDIVSQNLTDAAEIRRLLVDDKHDFTDLATHRSVDKQLSESGGLLPAFSALDEAFPQVFRDAAFRLQNPGDITPNSVMTENGYYHILKLEKRIPSQNVKFEDVKEELRKNIQAAKERNWANTALNQLMADAHINVADPILAAQFEQIIRARNEAAQRAADATQPASNPK